jgi:outer membrane biosynthesis protein TonB
MRRLILLLLLLIGCSDPPPATSSIAAARSADADDSFSQREKDGVRRQIERYWLIDPSMPGLETMEAAVIVEFNPDGSVQSARVAPTSIRHDPNWKLFAEACLRAVTRASPLKMPPDKPYAAWKTITFRFNAREMLGLN